MGFLACWPFKGGASGFPAGSKEADREKANGAWAHGGGSMAAAAAAVAEAKGASREGRFETRSAAQSAEAKASAVAELSVLGSLLGGGPAAAVPRGAQPPPSLPPLSRQRTFWQNVFAALITIFCALSFAPEDYRPNIFTLDLFDEDEDNGGGSPRLPSQKQRQ